MRETQIVQDLLDRYEEKHKRLLLEPEDREYLIEILASIYDFSLTIGMQNCYELYFSQVIYFVMHSGIVLECLNPNNRYCADMKKAIKLFVLIIALQNKCYDSQDINTDELSSLVEIHQIEELIDKHIKKDRSIESALLFFNKLLNEMLFPNAPEKFITFETKHFAIDEILITESALMALLGAYQLVRELESKSLNVRNSLKYFFKIYYIFYSDIYFCLSHEKFSNILKQFLLKYSSDGKQLRFFFEFTLKLLEDLKSTSLLDQGTLYQEKLLHPFETINNLHDIVYSFYEKIQTTRTDYNIYYDKYAKNLKTLMYYTWSETNSAYQLAKKFNDNSFDIEETKIFINELLSTVQNIYYDTDLLPSASLLSFFGNTSQSLAESATASSLFDSITGKVLDVVKQTNIIKNKAILDLVDNQMLKNIATGFLQNMGKNIGSSVQTNVVQKYVTINFKKISKGILWFWTTLGKSNELKDLSLKGNNQALIDKFIDIIKTPAVNLTKKGFDKIPYSYMVNSQNIGTFLDVLLRQARLWVGKHKIVEDAPFTSGEQMISGFARSVEINTNGLLENNDT